MRGGKALAGIALLLTVGAARGDLYNFNGTWVDVAYWAGTGAKAAMMVTDFGASSCAFGFRWDGSATGQQMVDAVAAAGALDAGYQDFGWGLFLNTLSYGGQTMGSAGYPTDWLAYWISGDGLQWTESQVGASSRSLTDGAWDGWARQFEAQNWPSPPSESPLTPVPEPGAVGLFAAGAALLAARLRRRAR
jgi:hypothetical protein